MPDLDQPLRPIVSAWMSKLKIAYELKKKEFQDDADEAMMFFNGPYDWLYGLKNALGSRGFVYAGDEGELPRPTFAMTVNKVAEMVQLFGPALYHRNPIRQVNPRVPPELPLQGLVDPNDQVGMMLMQQAVQQTQQRAVTDQARAALMSAYSNYTPNALDLKTESRWAIDEAIIKGRGVLWSEIYTPAGGNLRLSGSFFDTVDNLLVDMDVETMRDATWIARRRIRPYWEFEDEFGLPRDSLKSRATLESGGRQAEVQIDPNADYNRRRGLTNDLLVVWYVYSKMGIGGRLSGVPKEVRDKTEAYGKYVRLCMTENAPFPLNVPEELARSAFNDSVDMLEQAAAQQEVKERLRWPTPYWADDTWPVSCLDFHPVPRKVWPMSHVKPGMGELKFINWAYSFLAGKVKTACRDFIAIAKSAGEELKENIRTGQDYTFIEVEALHGSIDAVVKFLQHPEFNQEIYKVIEGVAANFEKRTGLTELMYGMSSRQLRSAEEAQVKGEQVSIRPDDMANRVEDWMSDVARKEALAAGWHLQGQDVAPILGPMGAYWWNQLIAGADRSELLHQLEYRIEAGSARKPNKARDAQNMQQAMQALFQPLFGYAQSSGNIGPINALIMAWAKSIDLDAKPFLLQPPPPPPQPAGPTPEQLQQQHEQQLQQGQEKQGLDIAKQRQQMAIAAQKHLADMTMAAQKHAVDIQTARAKAQGNGAMA